MKIDRIPARARASFLPGVAAACAAVLVSGCVASPTYGTGRTANAQLLDDLTGIVSTETLIGAQARRAEIAYTPRGELVRPASLEVLPEPQQELAHAGNPAWPESPEQRRARIRAEATENQDNPAYRPVVADRAIEGGQAPAPGATGQRPRQTNQGDPNARRYLSEPPLDYRVPSANAPAGELGEDEWKKEQARRDTGRSSWRNLVPWL